MNIAGILAMFSDKRRAVKKQYRIPEKTLFLLGILGGSAGCLLGMYLFRHKTRHLKFVIGMPLILIAQLAIALILLKSCDVQLL